MEDYELGRGSWQLKATLSGRHGPSISAGSGAVGTDSTEKPTGVLVADVAVDTDEDPGGLWRLARLCVNPWPSGQIQTRCMPWRLGLVFVLCGREGNHSSNYVPAQASDKASSSKQSSVNKNNARHPQKRKKLEIRMSTSHFDPEEFALYQRYQTKVHKDKIVTESSYRRFLVDTPIVFVSPKSGDNTVPPCGFGSFHQQYRIDGKLVAVGVVDILPKCLSSKYLFWDPDLAFLSLGKYTALKEIDWVRTTQEHCPSLQYYYLGYYIHSCNKMRYKAAYRPSELLCPVRYEWIRYDLAKPLLDKSLYSVLSDFATMQGEMPQPQICGPNNDSSAKMDRFESPSDEDDEDLNDYETDMMVDEEITHSEKADTTEDGSSINEIENIVLDLNGSRVKYKDLQQVFGPIERRHLNALEGQMSRYAKAVGKELSDRMVYSIT